MKNLFFALLVLTLTGLFGTSPVSAALYDNWHDQEKQVFNMVNLQRSHIGRSDLIPDSRLHVAADLHSQDMAENDYFAHTSQDGTTYDQRILAQNYKLGIPGENIAYGYTNAHAAMYGTDDLMRLSDFDLRLGKGGFSSWDEVGQGWSNDNWEAWDQEKPPGYLGKQVDGFGGWMGSKDHRGSILSTDFTDLGVGYYYMDPDPGNFIYNHYWTQNFASGDTAPVPIPPSMLLFSTGLIGMLGIRRYKK